MISVCPSTNPSPEDKLIDYVKELQSLGVEILHCDVMDGNFVPAKCLDLGLLKEVAMNTLMALDVHLMVALPLGKLDSYLKLPVSYLTVHYEAMQNEKELFRAIEKIQSAGKLAGISIKPQTDISKIEKYLELVDLVLVMTVEPGKSGQKFMPECLTKIKELDALKKEKGLNFKIEVDGGINSETAKQVVSAGAEMLVMGNALYTASDKKKLINEIEGLK